MSHHGISPSDLFRPLTYRFLMVSILHFNILHTPSPASRHVSLLALRFALMLKRPQHQIMMKHRLFDDPSDAAPLLYPAWSRPCIDYCKPWYRSKSNHCQRQSPTMTKTKAAPAAPPAPPASAITPKVTTIAPEGLLFLDTTVPVHHHQWIEFEVPLSSNPTSLTHCVGLKLSWMT